jgi:Protein of unknown function (DUF1579)
MLKSSRRVLVSACLGFGLSVVVGSVAAQEMPKPGPEHEALKLDVGTWDAVVEMLEPGKPPAVSKGTETVSVMTGGLWTVTDFKSTIMNAPFHGHGQNGFDPIKKKYVSTWVDSMSTGINFGEYTYDAKTKTMKGFMEGPDMTGRMMKMSQTTEWKDADTRVFSMSMPGPDGKDVPTMRITYKRRK